jgi:hypothetical protein
MCVVQVHGYFDEITQNLLLLGIDGQEAIKQDARLRPAPPCHQGMGPVQAIA